MIHLVWEQRQTCHTGQSHDCLLGICERSFFSPDYSINQSQSHLYYIYIHILYRPKFVSAQQTCGDILSKKQTEPAL